MKQSTLWLLAALLLALLLCACEKLAQGEAIKGAEHFYADEGVATERSMSGGAAGTAAPASPPMADMVDAPADGNAAGKPAGTDIKLKPEDFLKQQLNIDSWMSPKAYADENIPDTKYMIRTGDMTLQIRDYDDIAKKVEAAAGQFGGVVTDSSAQQQYDGTRSGYIKLRVPNEKFRDCFDALKELGDVTSENITSSDVSHEYVTAVSRLKALLTEQETLRNMLAEARDVQKSRGLGEAYSVLLETQSRLSEVTAQVQGIEDQVAQLADQITRSTITVNLVEITQLPKNNKYNPGYGETWERAKRDFVRGRDAFINGVIYLIGSFWGLFWILVGGGFVWWIVRKVRKASWADRAPKRGPAPPK